MNLNWTGIAKALSGAASFVWAGVAVYVVWLLRKSLLGVADRVTGVEGWGINSLSKAERKL